MEVREVVGDVRYGEHQPCHADGEGGIRSPRQGGDDARADECEVERADVADEVLVERPIDPDPRPEAGARERVVEGLRGEERPGADEGAEGVEDPEDDASVSRVHTDYDRMTH